MTTASEYGTFRLSYAPPAPTGREDYPLISIDMRTAGDATVDQMLRFYEAFLAAAGFVLKGDLQVVEREEDPWSVTTQGSQATDFVPFGSLSDDIISFGNK